MNRKSGAKASRLFKCAALCFPAIVLLLAINSAHAHLPTALPDAVGISSTQLQVIPNLVKEQIEAGNLPGAVVLIGRRGVVAYCEAFGHRQLEPTEEPMTVDTIFDMASITKPVATATSVMLLVQRGEVRLRDPIARHIPEFAANGKKEITVEQLLTHQGGLVPDNALADYQNGVDQAWKNIWGLKPVHGVGKKFVYTDVGFLVLGELVHRVTGKNVAEFAAENIFRPIGMVDSGYLPKASLHARVAPTEKQNAKWLRGEVHDPRASLLEGIAGHAGLFSTAHDLALYANMMLSGKTQDGTTILAPSTIREMTRARDVAGQKRGLGWDMRSKYSSNRSELFSQSAFGHGGFTGTAMWIDPELDLYVVFLSSRLHPDGVGSVNDLAGRIGTVAAGAIVGPNPINAIRNSATPSANPAPVKLGVDVLVREEFRQLKDRRVGLITNHTGLDSRNRRTLDLLHEAPDVTLVSLFSPEHGLQGKLDQPNITDTREEKTNLPVYSLYGESRRPAAERLQDIDTLVFDIQDIGTRFYTYISTMGHAMHAAAEHDLKFVVLDRPNPLGGELVEGPILDPGLESFVGYHPIAVRHGMTIGELALMFREELKLDLDLEIVEIENWRRQDYWDRTGLVWTNPSPNMRSLAEAVLYPGIGLMETTNVSVGRGTDTPFEVLGAPWMDGVQLAAELNSRNLPGVRFIPIRFTPTTSKHANEECSGVNITVIDRAVFLPVETGLAVAATVRKLYPDAWSMKGFNRLLCDQHVFDAIAAGALLERIKQDYRGEHEEFLKRRSKFLLYR